MSYDGNDNNDIHGKDEKRTLRKTDANKDDQKGNPENEEKENIQEISADKNGKNENKIFNYDLNDKKDGYESKEAVNTESMDEATKIETEIKPTGNIPHKKESEVVEKLKELFDVIEYKIT